jgi:hypothetical protein
MPLPLSAADMTRLLRIRGGSRYQDEKVNEKDINNVVVPSSGVLPFPIRRDVGSSKTRREASKWIDFVASQSADYVLQRQTGACATERVRHIVNCNCGATSPSILSPKVTGCVKCNSAQHLRM